MKDKLVLYQPWGGLGDNLQYSTLPEEFTKLGHDVYIHTDNQYRNSEIKDLVWGYNPFVKGYTSEGVMIGSSAHIPSYRGNWMSVVEKYHGLNTDNKYPKIYYTPKLIPSFVGKTIVERNSVTNPNYMETVIPDAIYINDKVLPSHKTSSIYELCDIIFSCKEVHCAYSGVSVLSSAIKRFNPDIDVFVYVPSYIYDCMYVSKNMNYYYDNLNYLRY